MTARTWPQDAQAIIQGTRHILLDFDGPVCEIFAGLPAKDVAASLRLILVAAGTELPEDVSNQTDPLEVFRFSAGLSREMSLAILEALTNLEMEAVITARPVPGAADFIRQMSAAGRSVSVVSNNSAAAVTAYLRHYDLMPFISKVSARTDANPDLMKPSPYLISEALTSLSAEASQATLIGDSVGDIQAAKDAGVSAIGYANRPGKAERLSAAGADAVVTSMMEMLAYSEGRY